MRARLGLNYSKLLRTDPIDHVGAEAGTYVPAIRVVNLSKNEKTDKSRTVMWGAEQN